MAPPNHPEDCLCEECKTPVEVKWYCTNCNKVIKVETQYLPREEGTLKGHKHKLQQRYLGPCPNCSVPKETAATDQITNKNRTADSDATAAKDEGKGVTVNDKEEKAVMDAKAGRRRIPKLNCCIVL